MNLIIRKNLSIKKYNTLRLESTAALVFLPLNTEGMLEAVFQSTNKKMVIIGNGSNVLFTKNYYGDEYVFIITTYLNEINIVNDEIVVDAGATFHDLAWFAMDNQVGGYEFCEDIPGTVGGALIMNAGQWQYTIGQHVKWIEYLNLNTNQVQTIIPDEDFFQYRWSKFNDMNVILLKAGLSIQKGEYKEVFDRMLEFKQERYYKQPRNYPNAGSVFKRPTKGEETFFVWKLFDEVSLRGYQVGGARISDKHPGFIVNVDNATPEDCVCLINECKKRVFDHFGITLELEWRVIE